MKNISLVTYVFVASLVLLFAYILCTCRGGFVPSGEKGHIRIDDKCSFGCDAAGDFWIAPEATLQVSCSNLFMSDDTAKYVVLFLQGNLRDEATIIADDTMRYKSNDSASFQVVRRGDFDYTMVKVPRKVCQVYLHDALIVKFPILPKARYIDVFCPGDGYCNLIYWGTHFEIK